eukprot:m.461856 g.461856  ORF g.461856 m.461856 type:complete len:225 (+) comp22436_c0_seq1:179-853(+)
MDQSFHLGVAVLLDPGIGAASAADCSSVLLDTLLTLRPEGVSHTARGLEGVDALYFGGSHLAKGLVLWDGAPSCPGLIPVDTDALHAVLWDLPLTSTGSVLGATARVGRGRPWRCWVRVAELIRPRRRAVVLLELLLVGLHTGVAHGGVWVVPACWAADLLQGVDALHFRRGDLAELLVVPNGADRRGLVPVRPEAVDALLRVRPRGAAELVLHLATLLRLAEG